MKEMTRNFTVKIGDKVAYSVQFLKSIGMSHSNMAHARGVISETKPIGDTVLAKIDWNNKGMPERFNINNLALVGTNRYFCNID